MQFFGVDLYILSDIGSHMTHIQLIFSLSSLSPKHSDASTISSSSMSSSDALIYDSMEEHDDNDENTAAVNQEVPELNDPLLRLRE